MNGRTAVSAVKIVLADAAFTGLATVGADTFTRVATVRLVEK